MLTVKVTLPESTPAFSLARALLALAEEHGLKLSRNARGYVLAAPLVEPAANTDQHDEEE